MVIKDSFHIDNICIWKNIKAYYSNDLKVLSEEREGETTFVTVEVKSKREWEQKIRDANR